MTREQIKQELRELQSHSRWAYDKQKEIESLNKQIAFIGAIKGLQQEATKAINLLEKREKEYTKFIKRSMELAEKYADLPSRLNYEEQRIYIAVFEKGKIYKVIAKELNFTFAGIRYKVNQIIEKIQDLLGGA